MSRIKFLNVQVDNLTFAEALAEIDKLIQRRVPPSYVVTPNVDHIVKLESDAVFMETYRDADLILADGKPLLWISRLKGIPIKEKVSGSDLFPAVCRLAAERGYSIFFLGGAAGVPERAAANARVQFPSLQIVGVYSPCYGFENNPKEIAKVIEIVRKASPDILAVGLGAPKQEKFIHQFRNELGVPFTIAMGAGIDFLAGNVKRAPRWMQKAGLEWFYRLCKEPRRLFKRYLVDDLKIIKLFFKY